MIAPLPDSKKPTLKGSMVTIRDISGGLSLSVPGSSLARINIAPNRNGAGSRAANQDVPRILVPEISRRKKLVMVFMDETYVDLSMASGKVPIHADPSDRGPSETKAMTDLSHKTNTEDRFIIIHALTLDGLLAHPKYRGVVEQDAGQNGRGSRTLSKESPLLTAECVCWCNKIGYKEYHRALKGEDFNLWLETRLQPAFAARYGPNASMVLVLDSTFNYS